MQTAAVAPNVQSPRFCTQDQAADLSPHLLTKVLIPIAGSHKKGRTVGSGNQERAQRIECSQCRHADRSVDPQSPRKCQVGMAAGLESQCLEGGDVLRASQLTRSPYG